MYISKNNNEKWDNLIFGYSKLSPFNNSIFCEYFEDILIHLMYDKLFSLLVLPNIIYGNYKVINLSSQNDAHKRFSNVKHPCLNPQESAYVCRLNWNKIKTRVKF